jgi:hypothetical protein
MIRRSDAAKAALQGARQARERAARHRLRAEQGLAETREISNALRRLHGRQSSVMPGPRPSDAKMYGI